MNKWIFIVFIMLTGCDERVCIKSHTSNSCACSCINNIEKQNEYNEQLQRNFYNTERQIIILQRRIATLGRTQGE
jgi:hypothetical protein